MKTSMLRLGIRTSVNDLLQHWLLWLLLCCGAILRAGRLAWQPLWADEGYSLYFATESLGRMIDLTAHDIHPPFYYALLHLWMALPRLSTPLALRLFSGLIALPALALMVVFVTQLFPGRRRLMLLATLLLAMNPLHLFYSQEVRMYGLTLTLSLAATLALWQSVINHQVGDDHNWSGHGWLIIYILTTTAALYTLYYTALLFLAHALWLLWQLNAQRGLPREVKRIRQLLGAYLLIGLLYLPWLYYVTRALTAYVADKIGADQDLPLGVGSYLARHLMAFVAGHLTVPTWPLWWRTVGGALVVLLLLAAIVQSARRRRASTSATVHSGSTARSGALLLLWFCVLIPTAIAFIINRFFPFFPDGGERLLLFILPYFLLLVAIALDQLWQQRQVGKFALLILLISATGGIWAFYTVPRHVTDDYRPLVQQVVQQGTDDDTLLATFPWQVGLWRVYAPLAGLPVARHGNTSPQGPHLHLISERAVIWGETVQTAIDAALAQGTLWYPGLRSIGSTLPAAVDSYLADRAVMLVDNWHGTTTLRAWHQLPAALEQIPVDRQFGPLQLHSAAVAPTRLAAANTPLRVDLHWSAPVETAPLGMTLRLYRDGHLWANRDLSQLATTTLTTTTGLLIPAGLPPGGYELRLGVVDEAGTLIVPKDATTASAALITLMPVTITAPEQPLLPARLPIQQPLAAPVEIDGVNLLGYSVGDPVPLAGEVVDVTLFWQNQRAQPAVRNLYLSLLDEVGNGVAGWAGWPLPDYPLTAWPVGALVQTPITILLPPTLTTGTYRLGGGLIDPATGEKSPFVLLGTKLVRQRTAHFTPVAPPELLAPAVQLGSHVRLLGYGLATSTDQLTLQLYWQVLEPLLPPHHIFVHLDDPTGQTVAQSDGPPMTATGPAPTGSWQPGEYLVTDHLLRDPGLGARVGYQLSVGLYWPESGARLPISVAGVVIGDAVVMPVK